MLTLFGNDLQELSPEHALCLQQLVTTLLNLISWFVALCYLISLPKDVV